MAQVIRFTRRGSSRRSEAGALLATRADGWFEGYATKFGVPDGVGDVMVRGAFSRMLARKKAGDVKLLYQHAASEPIGVWTEIYEDAVGLFVRGRVVTDVQRGREVLALMREGALDGLSLGFKTIRARTDRTTRRRTVLEADLWEVSVVTFPMLGEARVTRVG